MPKKYNIKWNEADNLELRRAVKNFNAKVTRLQKKNPGKAYAYPEKVSVSEIKELITTRSDLKRELNSLRRFSKKGSEDLVKLPDNDYNTTITKWQRNEMSRRVGTINRKRSERYKDVYDMQLTHGGKPLGYTAGGLGMGAVAENELKPMNAFTRGMTRKEAHWKFKALRKENQDQYWDKKEEILRQNYIKQLRKDGGFLEEDIWDVAKEIEEMDFKKFYKKYLEEGGTFEHLYPDKPGTPQYEANVNLLRKTWLPKSKRGAE